MKIKALLRSPFAWFATIASKTSFLIGWFAPALGGVWFITFFLLSILPSGQFYERLGRGRDPEHIFLFFLAQWFFALIGLIVHFGR